LILRTYYITTLGCPKNLVDSEIVAGMLDSAGWQMAPNPLEATLLVVNTCAFVDSAQEESLEALLSAITLKKEGACALVAAAGCLVQRYGHELSRKLPDLDLLVGVRDFHRLVSHIEAVGFSPRHRRLHRLSRSIDMLYDRPRRALEIQHIRYLKIAEGCDCSCGFCTIPSIRGVQHSRPVSLLVAEARSLLSAGAKELIVVAQDTTSYGIDSDGCMLLPTLLKQLAALVKNPEQTWIRVMYLQPYKVSTALIDAMNLPGILPYFDLALQHSSPRVLRSMRRPVPPQGWEPLIDSIRSAIPDAVLRASLLLGHPGETDASFQHLLRFLKTTQLDRVGVFAFSPQEDTPSAALAAPSPDAVDQRMQAVETLLAHQAEEKFKAMRGHQYHFMIDGEGTKPGELTCRPWFDCPEIDWQYTLRTKPVPPGTVIPAHVVGGRAGEVVLSEDKETG
jgi:ribosomal protein S12 methylthiotransferase